MPQHVVAGDRVRCDHRGVDHQARREAIAVEIVYAVLPSALLIAAPVLASVLVSRTLGLQGQAWGAAALAGLIFIVLTAVARTIVILFRTHKRGL